MKACLVFVYFLCFVALCNCRRAGWHRKRGEFSSGDTDSGSQESSLPGESRVPISILQFNMMADSLSRNSAPSKLIIGEDVEEQLNLALSASNAHCLAFTGKRFSGKNFNVVELNSWRNLISCVDDIYSGIFHSFKLSPELEHLKLAFRLAWSMPGIDEKSVLETIETNDVKNKKEPFIELFEGGPGYPALSNGMLIIPSSLYDTAYRSYSNMFAVPAAFEAAVTALPSDLTPDERESKLGIIREALEWTFSDQGLLYFADDNMYVATLYTALHRLLAKAEIQDDGLVTDLDQSIQEFDQAGRIASRGSKIFNLVTGSPEARPSIITMEEFDIKDTKADYRGQGVEETFEVAMRDLGYSILQFERPVRADSVAIIFQESVLELIGESVTVRFDGSPVSGKSVGSADQKVGGVATFKLSDGERAAYYIVGVAHFQPDDRDVDGTRRPDEARQMVEAMIKARETLQAAETLEATDEQITYIFAGDLNTPRIDGDRVWDDVSDALRDPALGMKDVFTDAPATYCTRGFKDARGATHGEVIDHIFASGNWAKILPNMNGWGASASWCDEKRAIEETGSDHLSIGARQLFD